MQTRTAHGPCPARSLALALALLAAAGPAVAQRFVGKPAPDAIVAGRLLLQVTEPPSPMREGEVVAVRLDGRGTELCRTLPWRYSWDTTTVSDGLHSLELLRTDVNTGRELVTDVLRVTVRNRAADRPNAALQCRRTERELTFHTSIDPLKAPATALYAADGKLYIGAETGEVVEYDPVRAKARGLRVDADGGQTKAIAVSGDEIWWLTGPADIRPTRPDPETPGISIRVIPPRLLFGYSRASGKLVTLDVDDALLIGPPDSPSPQRMDVRAIVPWRGRVVLVGARDARVIDPESGRASRWDTLLPEAAQEPGAVLAGFAADARRALAVVETSDPADPARAIRQLWTADADGRWTMRQTLETDDQSVDRPFCLVTPDRVVLVAAGSLTQWRVGPQDVSRSSTPLPAASQLWGWTEKAAIGAGRFWWVRSGRVFHTDLDAGSSDVLMPWRGAPREVTGLVAEGRAAWVTGSTGVVRLDMGGAGARPSHPGYVRARLGPQSAAPADDLDRRLLQIVQDWQGVPYKWGGSSKTGTDCSGFVMAVHRELGVDIPHGSKELRTTRRGQVVTDELRLGDVLTYPGHAALYIGDGRTAETIAGGVGMGAIFGRDDVVVRRFLRATSDDDGSARPSRRARKRTH